MFTAMKSGKARVILLLIALQAMLVIAPHATRVREARGVEPEPAVDDATLIEMTEMAVCTWIPPLAYPDAVPRKSLSGCVVVSVMLDGDGQIIDTEVLESDLPELFIVEALKSARRSRFKGRTVGGVPQPSSVVLPFRFDALEAPAPAPEPEPDEPVVARDEPADAPARETRETEMDRADPPADETKTPAPDPVVEKHRADAEEAATAEQPPAGEMPAWLSSALLPGGDRSPLTLADAAFGTGVSNRELAGRGERFTEGERVYCWVEIEGGKAGDAIKHVWKRNGRAIQEIDLTLRGAVWRTWSYKTLFAGLAGSWEVEILDGDGRLLGKRTFECAPAAPPADED